MEKETNSSCKIRLLGPLQIEQEKNTNAPRFRSKRTQALLGYLIAVRRSVARDRLTALFWPDLDASTAKANLRRELHNLNHILPDCWDNAQMTVRFSPTPDTKVDIYEAQRLANAGEWAAATKWLRGEFLEGVALFGNLEAESWLRGEREHWHLQAEEILLRASQVLWQNGAVAEAQMTLRRLTQLSPWHEEAHRQLMHLLARQGQFGAAIRQYQRCEEFLQKELGVLPSLVTQVLYERIVAGQPFPLQRENEGKNEEIIPLIGRQVEWARVQEFCSSLQPGESRCLWISGEAGIGKTRFANELLAWGYLSGYAVVRTRSYSAHGDLAFAPVAQLFRVSHLAERLVQLDDLWLGEIARIVPELLVERPDIPKPGPLSRGEGSVRFYEALCQAILMQKQPVMLLFDDLQWCDEETFAWLHYLLRHEHRGHLLLVGTYRNEEISIEHPLREISNSLYREGQLFDLALSPLSREDAARLAEAVCKDRLDAAAWDDLFESTRGNPLFVVETMRARLNNVHFYSHVRITDVSSGEILTLPPKIFALIQQRLSKLSLEAQEVLKVAAIIGRSFENRLLLKACHLGEETGLDILTELSDKRVIGEQKAGVFDFTHDKLRDVTLAQVGIAQKQLLSGQIAEAYEAVYGDRLEEFVGELAVVYETAGQVATAVSYYHQAAQAENLRGAYKRAETYLEKALVLIGSIGEQRESAAVERNLQMSLANVARVIRRNTVPKAKAAFVRALELSEAMGDQAGRFQALFGLAQYHMTDAELAQASHYCEASIKVARQMDDEASLIRASLMFGFICLIRGELRLAKENLERVCSNYTSDLAEALRTLQGEDTAVMANIYLSCVLWLLGYPEQSDEKMAVAQVLAQERGLPINMAFVCFYQMLLSQIKHDVPAAGQFADRLVAMSEKYDIGFTLTAGYVGQAYIAAVRNRDNQHLFKAFELQLTHYHEQVSRLSQPFYLSLKARLLIATAQYEEAQTVLSEAIDLVDALDDRYSASEVYRLQGELWAITGIENPEKAYMQAIALAEDQQAKMFQIRTAVSLCRFWRGYGKQEDAHRLLSGIYDWFSEGSATAELQEARALLNELMPSYDVTTARGRAARKGEFDDAMDAI